jgi:hypothetical protein
MRLINTSTLALETFRDAVPPYAILSHRWNDEEVSFQDLQNGKGKKMTGYSKIQRCCAQAQFDGWQHAWIDSCCIDKTSSAEYDNQFFDSQAQFSLCLYPFVVKFQLIKLFNRLHLVAITYFHSLKYLIKPVLTSSCPRLSEAINSMYQWYKDSKVCYAHLGDVWQGKRLHEELRHSIWFTRGWTLQELLAPSTVIFFDHDWHDIGSKGSLEEVISEITGIDDFVDFETACVAQKMSWVAQRTTTRVEDIAYCLLGLFNVNMPPLYGEGEKAFMRLQLEILKTSDDESIFAWNTEDSEDPPAGGLLASSPNRFKNAGSVRPLGIHDHTEGFFQGYNHPFSMTNKGLYISLPLIPRELTSKSYADGINRQKLKFLGHFIAPLKCSWVGRGGEAIVCPAIILRRGVVNNAESYCRLSYDEILLLNLDDIRLNPQIQKETAHKYIYVKEDGHKGREARASIQSWSFSIRFPSLRTHDFIVSQRYPRRLQFNRDNPMEDELAGRLDSFLGDVAGVKFMNTNTRENIVLVIIAKNNRSPWLTMFTLEADKELREITKYCYDKYVRLTGHQNYEDDTAASVASSDLGASEHLLRSTSKKRPPLDRMSRLLRNGMSVSASLRHVPMEYGGKILVHIGIDRTGVLKWPAPAWVDTLLVSLGMNDMKPKEQRSGDNLKKQRNQHQGRAAPVVISVHKDIEKTGESGRKAEGVHWYQGREDSRSGRMIENQQEGLSRRQDTRNYRQPESQQYSQHYERRHGGRDRRGSNSGGNRIRENELTRDNGESSEGRRGHARDYGW